MQIPGLGEVVEDADLGWYRSEAIPEPVLGMHVASSSTSMTLTLRPTTSMLSSAFLALDSSGLTAAEPWIFASYRDVMNDEMSTGDTDCYVEIERPHDVFEHIQLGNEPVVARRAGDRHVYVSLECECDWEPAHGLQIVFRGGRVVTKVGLHNGYLINSAAYADATPAVVVYRSSRCRPRAAPSARVRPGWSGATSSRSLTRPGLASRIPNQPASERPRGAAAGKGGEDAAMGGSTHAALADPPASGHGRTVGRGQMAR